MRRSWALLSPVMLTLSCGPGPPSRPVPEGCGGGSWRPGTLELHQLALGQADAALIVGPTGRTLLFDAGEPTWDGSAGAQTVGAAIQRIVGCRRLDHVVLSHFHVDHVGMPGRGGLWHLVMQQGFEPGVTLHRDLFTFSGETSGTLRRWRAELAGPAGPRYRATVAALGTHQVDLGPGVTFRIVAVDGADQLLPGAFDRVYNPPSENDYSVAAVLRYGRMDVFLGGDLSGAFVPEPHGARPHDIELEVARRVGDVDVYRVNHHGSERSSSPVFLGQLDPEVAIVSAGRGNRHGHPHTSAVARITATADLHTTFQGDVIVRSDDGGATYTVNGGSRRAAIDPRRVDRDQDGFFAEIDPDDQNSGLVPVPRGQCEPTFQPCVGAAAH